jgi:hypothetical protein
MSAHFNPPPNWPKPPEGWTPPPDWKPDPAWGPAPEGWQLWTESPEGAPYAAAAEPPPAAKSGSWFGRHKVLTGVAAVAAVGIAIGVATSGGGSADAEDAPAKSDTVASEPAPGNAGTTEDVKDAEAPAEKPAEKPAATTPGLNAAVRDGTFEFSVTSVEPGVKTVGDQYLNKTAQGQFVLVHINVKNIGDQPQTFFDSNQKLFNAAGQKFSADSSAAIYLDGSSNWIAQINPGNSVDAIVVFDVPVDMVPTAIQLHDSAFSGGVKVALS